MSTRIAGLLSLGLVSSLTAQPVIVEPFLGGRAYGAMVHDTARGQLVLCGGDPDMLGSTFTARLDQLGPPANLPILWLGDSKTLWNGVPLPFDLAPLGMPGCSLLAGAALTFPLTNLGGSATWTIAIPNGGLQVGSRLYVQAAVTSPGANAAGIVVSNAGELVLGAK